MILVCRYVLITWPKTLTREAVKLPKKTCSIQLRHKLLYACTQTHPHKRLLSLFLTQVHSQYKAVSDTVLTTGGAPNQRSQFLAVMCQHDSRLEIQTGSLSVPPPSTPSCCWILFPFFFWSNSVSFFVCLIPPRHLGETEQPKEN